MSQEKNYPIDLSIVIPLYNEQESLPELHEWITRVVTEMGVTYEIIFIDDGSTGSRPGCRRDSSALPVPSSSRWMPTCRTLLMRSPSSIG